MAPLVLVVDDEESITITTAAILEMHGYRVITANDGESALHLAISSHPNLVLTDVIMPRLNGVQLAIALTEALPATNILLFSGNAATSDILEAARTQGYNFTLLAKPVPMDEMLGAIRSALDAPPQSAAA